MSFIYKAAKQHYVLPNSSLEGPYDAAVVIDYGALKGDRDILPEASKEGLKVGARLMKMGMVRSVIWANSPFMGITEEQYNFEKNNVLSSWGASQTKSLQTPACRNTIDEAEKLCQSFSGMKRIVLIADQFHMPRTLKIWRTFFEGEIAILNTESSWSEGHRSPLCNGVDGFILLNICHHLGLKVLGVDRLRKFGHPESR